MSVNFRRGTTADLNSLILFHQRQMRVVSDLIKLPNKAKPSKSTGTSFLTSISTSTPIIHWTAVMH